MEINLESPTLLPQKLTVEGLHSHRWYISSMPKRYQDCTAKCPFCYKEDLPKHWVKPLPKDAKSPLPVDVPRSKPSCSISLLTHSTPSLIRYYGLDWQNNNFALASPFFVHFFAVVARLQRENAKFHVSPRTATQNNDFLFFFWTFIQSFGIPLQRNLPTFNELNEIE